MKPSRVLFLPEAPLSPQEAQGLEAKQGRVASASPAMAVGIRGKGDSGGHGDQAGGPGKSILEKSVIVRLLQKSRS